MSADSGLGQGYQLLVLIKIYTSQGDQLNMTVCFWYLVKKAYLMYKCTVAYTGLATLITKNIFYFCKKNNVSICNSYIFAFK